METRRNFLTSAAAGAGAMALSSCSSIYSSPSESVEFESLNDIAQSRGMRFGNAIASWEAGSDRHKDPFQDEAYMDIVKSECGILVAENEFKRYTLQPVAGPYKFDRANRISKFANTNSIDLRGHTLLWNRNEFIPKWVQELDFNAHTAEAHLREYFSDVISHFGDQVYSWDVVNETIAPETGVQRDTVFSGALGSDLIDLAFRIAREYAPKTQLVYNDFMSWETHSRKHRKGVLEMLADLRKRGTPIDALGIQGHLGTFAGDFETGYRDAADRDEWVKFLQEVKDMDYDVIITEFDVNDEKLPADISKRDRIVADYAKDYLDRTLAFTNVKEILTWGLVDQHSWLQTWWPREDGLDKRPTPYDMNYRPKPLRAAIAKSMSSAPLRAPLEL